MNPVSHDINIPVITNASLTVEVNHFESVPEIICYSIVFSGDLIN